MDCWRNPDGCGCYMGGVGVMEPTFEELAQRLSVFLSPDVWAGTPCTTTQVKLGVAALAEIVGLLETHAVIERGH